jgi:hypothetical protein
MPRPVGTTKPHLPGPRPQDHLRPLPMRVSQRSYDRLNAVRSIDGNSVQEHIRRGIDYYLDHVEVVLALAASEGLKQAISMARDSEIPKAAVIPTLLAKHAPRPIRSAAKVVTK